jgi:flagellar export protein FliJ
MRVSGSSLGTVIRVRDIQVNKAKQELAEIRNDREVAEGELQTLEEKQSSAMSDAVREMKTKAADLQTSQAFIQNLSRKIEEQGKKVDEIASAEEGKREELVERSQSKHMLEKIDQKRKEEFEKEQERKSQRIIDVLAQRMKVGF